MNVSIVSLGVGEPTNVVQLLPQAWEETPELHWGGKLLDVHERVVANTESCVRVELLAKDQNGRLVGCCVLVPDEDQHVGLCLGVMWNYVLPEWRGAVGRMFIRTAVRVAQDWGLPILAYTHRLGEGQYKLTYRRLHGQKS